MNKGEEMLSLFLGVHDHAPVCRKTCGAASAGSHPGG